MLAAALELVKDRLGIRTAVRDSYLTAIVNSVTIELSDEKGLVLIETNPYHLMFVVDYATWRYQSRDGEGSMPRHLQFRLHNLMLHVGAKNLRVNSIETVEVLPLSPSFYIVYIIDADDSKQMYIKDVWTTVDLIAGSWVVAI